MDIGMLWFDDSSRPLAEKVHRGVKYYSEKYGRTATLCVVNPDTLNGGSGEIEGVVLRAARSVLPDHFWIGVDEKARQDEQAQLEAA